MCKNVPALTQDSYDVSLREAVFRYYGTFTRTFLTMFETRLAVEKIGDLPSRVSIHL